MSYLHEEYHWLSTGKELKFDLQMNHATYHWGSGTHGRQRGYELSCTPTERSEDGMWSSFCGSDAGHFESLLACDRKSKKRTEEAIVLLKARVLPVMTHYEQKYNPECISWDRVQDSKEVFDASGIDNPDNWLWKKSHPAGLEVYYPEIQLVGKTREMVKEKKVLV